MRSLSPVFLTIACVASLTGSVCAQDASYPHTTTRGLSIATESLYDEPVDPVVEEPIRPLYPEDADPSLIEVADCGPLDILLLPVSLLLVGAVRLAPARCRGPGLR